MRSVYSKLDSYGLSDEINKENKHEKNENRSNNDL